MFGYSLTCATCLPQAGRIVDFVRERAEQTELPASRLVGWIGIGASKFFDWKRRYGQVNEHNAWAPRAHWLEDWEKGLG